MQKINQTVLMSGAEHFSVKELNPYENKNEQPNIEQSILEHNNVKYAFENAGITVVKVPAPDDCQDGIYTANWGLCWRGKAVLSCLPKQRQLEEPYAKHVIESLGYETIKPPYRFSGQGDCLPCGEYLFIGSHYRTDPEMHQFLKNIYGCNIVSLQTLPALNTDGRPLNNNVTGWPDSYFYDLDLALSVITPELIAWCPDAFTLESRIKVNNLPLEKIEVSLEEAKGGFACNLVSTGEIVIMSDLAPVLKTELEKKGFKTITPSILELKKGGGYIRCCSLTLD